MTKSKSTSRASIVRRRARSTPFRVGDRVVRNRAVGGEQGGDMLGTVRRVTATPFGSGGTRARIRVLWDNGHEAAVEDRQILRVKLPARGHQQ